MRVCAVAISVLVCAVLVASPHLAGAQTATPIPGATTENDGGGIEDGGWTLITAIVGVLGTLAGALGGAWWGHRLSENAARECEAAAEVKLRQGVRTLLRVEIDQNLAALQAFWDDILAVPPPAVSSPASATPASLSPPSPRSWVAPARP